MGLPSWPSVLQEGEPVFPDLDLVAVAQIGGLDALAVDERPVQAALVLQMPAVAILREDGVLAGHRDVVEEDRALGRASDRRRTVLEGERLPRPPAARADNEGSAEDA